MAFALTATLNTDAIRQVDLEWSGQDGRTVTIYRSTSAIDINPGADEEIDWTGATAFENLTGTSKIDAGLADGTYYYYAVDGDTVVAATGGAVTIAQDSDGYAPEIQPDYEPASIDKVSATDAYRNALNNGGSVKFNPINVPAGKKLAIVAIAGTDVAETSIATALAGLSGIEGFAVLQSGDVQNFTGYQARLSGSTQVQYIKG